MNLSGPSSLIHGSTDQLEVPIGIIGGSGFCTWPELQCESRVRIVTKYGNTSDEIQVGKVNGVGVAFIPRHGAQHSIPPHKVPYKANLAALQQLGVTRVIATCIAGSLNPTIRPGTLVVPDQFVNLTWGRDDTFEADGAFVHLPMAEPYCPTMRDLLIAQRPKHIRDGGTVVVIQGPRFSTIAESRWFSSNGWDLVNMTQYPECFFARELGICYASVAGITDLDVGIANLDDIQNPDRLPHVLKVFKACIECMRDVVSDAIKTQAAPTCACSALFAPYYIQTL